MARSASLTATGVAALALVASALVQVSASQPVARPAAEAPAAAMAAATGPTVSIGSLGPLAANVAHPPRPVLGTDMRRHLVYEINLINSAPAPQTLTLVEVLDATSRRVLARFDTPSRIRRVMTTSSTQGPGVDQLPPNGAGVIFLNVSLGARTTTPTRLTHHIVSQIGTSSWTTRGALTVVSRRSPARLSPPLVGHGYVNGNGCCTKSPHTRAVLTINGKQWLAQRFAIDWIRLDSQRRQYVGNFRVNDNWIVFGDAVVSASGGRVIETLNTMRENTPPIPAGNLTPYTALGNHVIVAIGDGRYVTYAHMQPGSVRVHVGQRVHPGQLLGRVGNTGSSTAPHLHFHVTDGPAAVGSNGTPYVFDRFRYTYRVLNVDEIGADIPAAKARLVPAPLPRWRTGQLPMTGNVVTFPGSRASVLASKH